MGFHIFLYILGLLTVVSGTTRVVNKETVKLLSKFMDHWTPCDYQYSARTGYRSTLSNNEVEEGPCFPTHELLIRSEIADAEECVDEMARTLTDNQFGALVSWAHSIGCSNARESKLVEHLRPVQNDEVCMQLKRWDKLGGKPVQLSEQSELECQLFTRTDENFYFYRADTQITCIKSRDKERWLLHIDGEITQALCLFKCDEKGDLVRLKGFNRGCANPIIQEFIRGVDYKTQYWH